MKAETLIFSWIRFEAVQVTGTREVPPLLDVPGGPGPSRRLILTASGRGRAWSTRTTQGFWRSFAGIDLGNEGEVLSFVRRFGDAYGDLATRQTCDTGGWTWLRDTLAFVARAWELASADGLSRISSVTEEHARARLDLFAARKELERIEAGFEPVAEPGSATIRLKPKSLAAYMIASAANGLDRGVPMRVCRTCGQWFEARRVDARTCSGSCRATFQQQKQKGA